MDKIESAMFKEHKKTKDIKKTWIGISDGLKGFFSKWFFFCRIVLKDTTKKDSNTPIKAEKSDSKGSLLVEPQPGVNTFSRNRYDILFIKVISNILIAYQNYTIIIVVRYIWFFYYILWMPMMNHLQLPCICEQISLNFMNTYGIEVMSFTIAPHTPHRKFMPPQTWHTFVFCFFIHYFDYPTLF